MPFDRDQAQAEYAAHLADLESAETLADLDALHFDWIGRSAIEDDPAIAFDSLKKHLRDYVNALLEGIL